MKWMIALAAVVSACGNGDSAGTGGSPGAFGSGGVGGPDGGAAAGPSDAGGMPDGSLVLTDVADPSPAPGAGRADAGPFPDGGLSWSPQPAPELTQQAAPWAATSAAGCEGLVPDEVAPRIAWAPADPSATCPRDPWSDGRGDLALPMELAQPPGSAVAFIPVDCGPSFSVGSGSVGFGGVVAREVGFILGAVGREDAAWRIEVGPGGAVESIASGVPPSPRFLATNGQGSFVQSTYWSDPKAAASLQVVWYLLRWVDAAGNARTPWYGVLTKSSAGFIPKVQVDLRGNALVLVATTSPTGAPCQSGPTSAAWVAPDGTVKRFTPVTPLGATAPSCQEKPFAGFGSAVPLPGGGFAFYLAPPKPGGLPTAPSGWYASYASMSPAPAEVPDWLKAYAAPIQRLASGAYLSVHSDAATCALTAQLVGRQGQLCATQPLEGSADCAAAPSIDPAGTVLMRAADKCAVTFWPHLAH